MALQVRRKEHKAEQSKQALIKSNSSGGRVQKGEEMDIDGLMMTALREERKSSVLQQRWEANLVSLYTKLLTYSYGKGRRTSPHSSLHQQSQGILSI